MSKKKKERVAKQKFSLALMWKQRYLLLMSVPFLIWLIIFKYVPLWGWTMAFQEVKPNSFALPIWERKFVGFDNFIKAFTDRLFPQTMINTIAISIIGIALGTFAAIVFALLLNEICFSRFKKVTQTISYLPHFVSWVIIASIAKMLLNDGGAIDTLLNTKLHLMSTNSPMFWVVVCLINVWKEVGWDAIVYLSAMAGIDKGLYEAAEVDGAGTFRCFIHVALPVCRPILGAAVALSFADCWNLVEQPLTYLAGQTQLMPLSVMFNQLTENPSGVEFAGAALYILPALLIYLYFQKDILSGIQLTELK